MALKAIVKYKRHSSIFTIHIKGADATCVEIATEVEKGFRLRDMLNFNDI